MATFTLASDFQQFQLFCVETGLDDHIDEAEALPSGLITNDEDDATAHDSDAAQLSSHEQTRLPPADNEQPQVATPTPVDFAHDGPPSPASEGGSTTRLPTTTNVNVIIDEEDRQKGSNHKDLAELLRIHNQYSHTSMRKLQEMDRQGTTIPKRLATCRIPTFPHACTRRLPDGHGEVKPQRPTTMYRNQHILDM